MPSWAIWNTKLSTKNRVNMKHENLNNQESTQLGIGAVMCRFLFIGWVIYRIIGIVFGVVISMPYWLITGGNVVRKLDAYFDRICPKVY